MIVIVSPTESNLTKRGKRHPNLAEFLTQKGETVCYVTTSFYHFEKRIFSKEELKQGKQSVPYEINYLHVGKYNKNISLKRVVWNLRFAIKVWLFLKKRLTKNDIVILPSRPSELLLLGRLLKIKCKCKLVVDVEDVWPDAFLIKNIIVKKLFYLYCNIFNYTGLKYFDTAFYVSPNFTDWIQRYNKQIKSLYAPLGIEEKYIVKNFKYLDEEPQKIFILYIGSLQFQIDLLPLCKAINLNKSRYKLILIGEDGKGQRYQEVMSFLMQHNIDYINKGFLSKEEVFEETQKAHLVVVPMISGGLPKKFFDAMGAGKPVLVIGKGGAATEVQKYNVGWIVNKEPSIISNTLEQINKEQINSKIKNIEKHIQQFSEKNSLLTIYKELNYLKQI